MSRNKPWLCSAKRASKSKNVVVLFVRSKAFYILHSSLVFYVLRSFLFLFRTSLVGSVVSNTSRSVPGWLLPSSLSASLSCLSSLPRASVSSSITHARLPRSSRQTQSSVSARVLLPVGGRELEKRKEKIKKKKSRRYGTAPVVSQPVAPIRARCLFSLSLRANRRRFASRPRHILDFIRLSSSWSAWIRLSRGSGATRVTKPN